tara:strand:+ start:246 stop:461 length:216 start_codon:yes stop_codon:yes gene_type:complete
VTKIKDLRFLKPGKYMCASFNRFVKLPRIEPCLVLENHDFIDDHSRYIVFAKNERLIAWDNNILNENEAVG